MVPCHTQTLSSCAMGTTELNHVHPAATRHGSSSAWKIGTRSLPPIPRDFRPNSGKVILDASLMLSVHGTSPTPAACIAFIRLILSDWHRAFNAGLFSVLRP